MRPARLDFLTSLVLLALGLAALYGGWSMDRLEIRRIHPASIPGLVPMLLGLALTGCAGLLLSQSIRAGGHRSSNEPSSLPEGSAKRLCIALLLTLVYPLILIGWLPFEYATGLFVFLFIALFEWPEWKSALQKAVGLATSALQAVIVALVVAYVFRELFLVRLP